MALRPPSPVSTQPLPAVPPPDQTPAGIDDTAGGPVVAPGYQGALLPAPAIHRPRWRAVRPDGTRLPPVGQLGAVTAQATTIAAGQGTAWIVGPGGYTVEITRAAGRLQLTATAPEPRWVATVRTAIRR
jgi:hypothetical protein